MGPEMPKDLDRDAKKKWAELVGSCDPDVDAELLGNYCRQHSSLLAIRSEKARQIKARTFEATAPGRDGSMQLNPLLTAENRMVASLNRMLRTLGLAPSKEEQARRRPVADEIDPLEAALCGPSPEPSAAEIEADRRRAANEKFLAMGDWRRYEAEHDEGRPPRKEPLNG